MSRIVVIREFFETGDFVALCFQDTRGCQGGGEGVSPNFDG